MCACTETNGFKEKLAEAKLLTEKTGEIHIVFALQTVKEVFVCKESDLDDSFEICCYFLSTGKEVVYKKKQNKSRRTNKRIK